MIAHQDPEKLALAEAAAALRAGGARSRQRGRPGPATGQPELFHEIDDEQLVRGARSEEHLDCSARSTALGG